MQRHYLAMLATIALVSSTPLLSQQTKIKKTPAPYTSPASGQEMFMAYCASCHGSDAKGDGPAAKALKVPPANLTELAQKNHGKFPADHVEAVLDGKEGVMAHGSKDMPVWGPVLSRISQGRPGETRQRIGNITRYLESLQGK